MQYDSWHTLEIDGDMYELGGHTDCPAYPDGPGPGDTAYGCPTAFAMEAHGVKGFYELVCLQDGVHQVRYWTELTVSYPDGPPPQGFEVKGG